jgi:hypothetical protein
MEIFYYIHQTGAGERRLVPGIMQERRHWKSAREISDLLTDMSTSSMELQIMHSLHDRAFLVQLHQDTGCHVATEPLRCSLRLSWT